MNIGKITAVNTKKLNIATIANNQYSKLEPLNNDAVSFSGAKNTDSDCNKLEKAKIELQSAIKNEDYAKVFEYFGVEVQRDEEDDKLTISEYKQPDKSFSYKDLGIEEDKMFQHIKRIKGDVHFGDVTDLGALEIIEGSASFACSKVENLGNLRFIGGDTDFARSPLTDLGNLTYIGGNTYFAFSKIESLGKLKIIGGNVYFKYSEIKDLGKLERIGGIEVHLDKNTPDISGIDMSAEIIKD